MTTFQIFDGLSKGEINRIIEWGMICPLPGGKLLFRKGDPGHEMFLILTGRIDIIDQLGDQGEIIAKLGPGEIFGEMAMFEEGHTRSTHAVVREPAQVLELSEDMLDNLLRKRVSRQFLINIIAMLCHRLRLTNSMYMSARYGGRRVSATTQSVDS